MLPFRIAALGLVAALCLPLAAPAQEEGERPPPLPYLLRLRPDQRPAWRAYNDELAAERAEGARAGQQAAALNAMTTPQRIDWRLAHLPEAEAQARRQAAAVRAFYAQLSPHQRRVFDRVTRAPEPPVQARAEAARPPAPPRSTLPQPPADAPLPAPARP